MSVVEGGPGSAGLVNRVMGLFTRPRDEWAAIDAEQATIPGLFTGYAMILAAIPALASMIGSIVFVHIIPLAVIGALIAYVLGLVGVFVFGIILEMLAPSFDAQKDRTQAMKLAVYSATGSWIGGILGIIPFIGWLGALAGGIFSLYLLFIGTPIIMKSPAEKSTGYTIVAIICNIVVTIVIGGVVTLLVGSVLMSMFAAGAAATGAVRGY
jgi:hypothetical protein